MTQQAVIQAQLADHYYWGISGFNSNLIDAAGEKFACIFQVPKTGNITKIGFRTVAVTSSQTLRVGLETLSSGNPSGTQYGGSAVGTQAAPAANTYYEVTLATPAAATRGDIVAIVIQFNSTVGNLNIASAGTTGSHLMPYTSLFTASWSKSVNGGMHSVGYDDGTYGDCFLIPASAVTQTTFNSSSTPDERALKFKLPFPASMSGVYARMGSASGGNPQWVLYDSDGTTVLQTLSITQNTLQGTGNDFGKYRFAASVALKANTYYYLSLKPGSTTNVSLYDMTVQSAAMLGGHLGGADFHLATRTDAGAWTATTTIRPFIGLIFDSLDDGASPGQKATMVQAAGSF